MKYVKDYNSDLRFISYIETTDDDILLREAVETYGGNPVYRTFYLDSAEIDPGFCNQKQCQPSTEEEFKLKWDECGKRERLIYNGESSE